MLMACTPLGRQVSMHSARRVDAASIGGPSPPSTASTRTRSPGSAERYSACSSAVQGLRRAARAAAASAATHPGGRLHGDGVVLAAAGERR